MQLDHSEEMKEHIASTHKSLGQESPLTYYHSTPLTLHNEQILSPYKDQSPLHQ